jgi:hypothetical protein
VGLAGTAGAASTHRPVPQAAAMGKGDPNKPRGKMSSYAFFVQTCREEHKKKHPDSSVNFAEFSKKCSERWKVRGAGTPSSGASGSPRSTRAPRRCSQRLFLLLVLRP